MLFLIKQHSDAQRPSHVDRLYTPEWLHQTLKLAPPTGQRWSFWLKANSAMQGTITLQTAPINSRCDARLEGKEPSLSSPLISPANLGNQ